jgi:hypothetical protein
MHSKDSESSAAGTLRTSARFRGSALCERSVTEPPLCLDKRVVAHRNGGEICEFASLPRFQLLRTGPKFRYLLLTPTATQLIAANDFEGLHAPG